MNYDVKLYVHGVPHGQSTWGVESSDDYYIEAFYGRKSDVPVQMVVEVRKFGSNAYCYYTYLRTNNMSDSDGRTGSYFALTIRVNYYYADIRNIYNLLDAAYNKFVVGSVVSINGEVTKYLVSDFSQADVTFKSLEKEITNYLMQFSRDKDFKSLSDFSTSSQNGSAAANLNECDTNSIYDHVKNNSSISVSPLYPSTEKQRLIKKMAAEIDAIKNKANRDITAANRDKEVGIQAVRNEYKDSASTISTQRDKIAQQDKKIFELEDANNKLVLENKNLKAYKDKYNKANEDLGRINEILNRAHDCISGLSGLPGILKSNPQRVKTDPIKSDHPQDPRRRLSLIEVVQKVHPFVDLLVMIVLLAIIGITLPKSCESDVPAPDNGIDTIKISIDSTSIISIDSISIPREYTIIALPQK